MGLAPLPPGGRIGVGFAAGPMFCIVPSALITRCGWPCTPPGGPSLDGGTDEGTYDGGGSECDKMSGLGGDTTGPLAWVGPEFFKPLPLTMAKRSAGERINVGHAP